MNIYDLFKISPDDPSYENARLQYLEGTYKSNWDFLVKAIRSNLINAAENTSKLIAIYERANSRGQRQAETLFVINFNYSMFLAGPLLGTILSTSASLEVFLRMCARAFLEQDTHQQARGKGTMNQVVKKLAEFDKSESFRKLERVYKNLLKKKVPTNIFQNFKELTLFRNNCFHADPVLIKSNGGDQTTRRGRIKEVHPPRQYPFLWDGIRPLSLTHALQAVRLHDNIVCDLFVRRSPKFYLHTDIHDEHPEFNLIGNGLPKALSPEVLDEVANTWDNLVDTQLKAVSDEEERTFLMDIQRKTVLHPVE